MSRQSSIRDADIDADIEQEDALAIEALCDEERALQEAGVENPPPAYALQGDGITECLDRYESYLPPEPQPEPEPQLSPEEAEQARLTAKHGLYGLMMQDNAATRPRKVWSGPSPIAVDAIQEALRDPGDTGPLIITDEDEDQGMIEFAENDPEGFADTMMALADFVVSEVQDLDTTPTDDDWCMCGIRMGDHTQSDNHAPVSQAEYVADASRKLSEERDDG